MRGWLSDATGLANLQLTELAEPVAGENDVLIDVRAAALNFSDILMIDDRYQVKPPRPFTPGQEVAGVIVSAPQQSKWQVGDRVATKVYWGGFAERVAAPANMPIALPPTMDFAKAAAIPVSYTTALVALTECTDIHPGSTVLVHAAAGGVGLAAVQIAASKGATVIATAGSDAKLALAKEHGAAHVVSYRDESWTDAVRKLAPQGANIIVDPVGGDIGENSLRCIARDGRLLVVGFASGTIPRFAGNRLLLKRAAAVGVYWNHAEDPAMLADVTRRLAEAITSGVANPVVDVRSGLAALPQALDDLKMRRSTGKIVLEFGDQETST